MIVRAIPHETEQCVAVLYSALPIISGRQGTWNNEHRSYAEGGADIAYRLHKAGINVVFPVETPNPVDALDWVFADTISGIKAAESAGADILWANTLLTQGHPLERVMRRLGIIGQIPSFVERTQNKFETNALLRRRHFPVPPSAQISRSKTNTSIGIEDLTLRQLHDLSLRFPLVIKPAYGHTGRSVSVVQDLPTLVQTAKNLSQGIFFEDSLIVEKFLPGEELSVIVMPCTYPLNAFVESTGFWALPPVRRLNHINGIIQPECEEVIGDYDRPLTENEFTDPKVKCIVRACLEAAKALGSLAPICIDCRADENGNFHLFDVNMTVAMDGPGRRRHHCKNSLAAMAARSIGWSYINLLNMILAGAWRIENQDPLQIYSDI